MTREEIGQLVSAPDGHRLEEFLAARAALSELPETRAVEARAEYQAALLKGDKAAARDALDTAIFCEAQTASLSETLERLIDDASKREGVADLEATAAEMRKLQRRGFEVGAEIHDTAERLAQLLQEHSDIEVRLTGHNAAVRMKTHRSDLLVLPPIEALSALVGISAVNILDPTEWELKGHWPLRADPHDDMARFDRFRDLMKEPVAASKSAKKKAA